MTLYLYACVSFGKNTFCVFFCIKAQLSRLRHVFRFNLEDSSQHCFFDYLKFHTFDDKHDLKYCGSGYWTYETREDALSSVWSNEFCCKPRFWSVPVLNAHSNVPSILLRAGWGWPLRHRVRVGRQSRESRVLRNFRGGHVARLHDVCSADKW